MDPSFLLLSLQNLSGNYLALALKLGARAAATFRPPELSFRVATSDPPGAATIPA